MELRSADGVVVTLSPNGYEFPEGPPDADPDWDPEWDPNWLVIHGEVHLADGRTWSFEHPCLTTWEARLFADWLAAAGEVPDGPPLSFTEPLCAFDIAERSEAGITLRVHLSAEALPPWLLAVDRPRGAEHVVEVRCTVTDLTAAGEQWLRELAAYPVR